VIKKGLIVLILLMLVGVVAKGQDTKPYGYFVVDSAKIGEIIPYSLSYKDKRNRKVIFPDSTFNYAPFELFDKAYFDTESDTINSIDSAVYYLATFEIDTIQKLALPVYIFAGEDSIEVFSDYDSIVLDQVVTQMPDSVALEETAVFQPVARQFNYPYWIIGLLLLGLISLIVMIIWGKQIRKRIKLYRLKKALEKFHQRFDEELEQLNSTSTKEEIESVLKYWKEYMEGLERIPYTKLTTKELVKIQQNGSLEETLKSIDKSIYSRLAVEELQDDFDFLKDYSTDRYHHITQEIKNA
jgi:hypothetical protein